MNSTLVVKNGDGGVNRLKRGAREVACAGLDYGSIIAGTIADVSGDISSVPIAGTAAGVLTAPVAVVSHLTKGGMDMIKTALGCSDIPFDEIKQVMNSKFSELDKKLDQNLDQLAKISDMVSKTLAVVEKIRIEMHKGFDRVVEAIESTEVKGKVNRMRFLVNNFESEKNRIRSLPKDDYIAKLKESNGFLFKLKESRSSDKDSLYTVMSAIITDSSAIPKNENDLLAFQALYALFFGTQTFVSIFGFLMDAHSYLANYYYIKADYERFNEQIDTIRNVFNDFRSSILGGSGQKGILAEVVDIVKTVKGKSFINKANIDIYKEVEVKSEILNKLKIQIKDMRLPIIRETPSTATVRFENSNCNFPFGSWKNGAIVKYAVQYELNGMYSRLSDWSDSVEISTKACPNVKTGRDQTRNKLVFRKFDNSSPQLAAVLSRSETEFRDINRDLYDVCGAADEDTGYKKANVLINDRANVSARFELGRTALHNAAKTCNSDIIELLLGNGAKVNTRDKKGYTALHYITDSDCADIITDLVERDADINAVTNEGYTPLHIATKNGDVDRVKEIIKIRKSNVNAKDKNGYAPLHFAVRESGRIVIELALGKHFDPNIQSNVGLSAAHLAVMEGNYMLFDILKVFPKFDINIIDRQDMTPLHYAVIMGNLVMVQMLIKRKGVNLNPAAKVNKWTPLHYAIFLKKKKIAIELIKDSKIDVTVKDNGDITPLHMASGTGQKNIVKEILLKKNIKLEDKTKQGYTAIHLATISDALAVVKFLKKKGAKLETRTKNNKTILDLAMIYQSYSVRDYLVDVIPPERFRRDFDSKNHILDSNTMRTENKGFGYGIAAVTGHDLTPGNLKLLDKENSFRRIDGASIQVIDGNGTLLLLDLLLRKLTNTKYDSVADGTVSDLEASARALSITEKFEEVLSALKNIPTAEQFNMSEVYSKIKRALLSGRNSKVRKILCSYAEMILSLKPEDHEKLQRSFELADLTLLNHNKQIKKDIYLVIEKGCTT